MEVVASKHPAKLTSKGKKSGESQEPLLEATQRYTSKNYIETPSSTFLPLEPAQQAISVQDIVASELQAARLLNVDMTDEPRQFIQLLENRIKEITGTRKNVILILDEESGTYTCLNDGLFEDFAKAPRELTWISDTYLQDLLGTDQVVHSFLHHHGNIFGIIAIAEKYDGSPFSLRDEIVLEQLSQYLSVQVNHFLTLKRSMMLPTIQRILLQISNRLLCAVDSAAIFEGALASLLEHLPFSSGQYIQLDRKTGKGEIVYQHSNGYFENGAPIKEVDQFISMLSLFQSQVWKHSYLYLKGEMLGDKAFTELFGLPDIVSVLLMPLVSENNQVDGALVLFQQKEAVTLSKEALKVIEQVSELVVSACGRAKVLEKALEIATTDELTSALNRRGFYSRFDAEVDRARRNMTGMCLTMIDIDHFKNINDTYGHLAGDQILRYFTKQIQKNIRKSDLLCRFGGEEFALMLPETSIQAATELLDRLRRKMERMEFQTTAGPIKVTFSAGIDAVETTQGLSKDAMQVISESLARADEALYEAKQLGRNRIVVVDQAI
jgi:diguanylate cyclase (GGDEF)-like protein